MKNKELRTIRTRYGTFTINRVQDKKMAAALENDEYLNEGLLTVARAFVNKKSTVVDIGAHIGTFTVPIATEVEKVIAFEPSSDAFALLSHNVKMNNAPAQLFNAALGSKKGSGTLVVRHASNAGANTLISGGDIPVTTLDREVTHADFIKIDVEGMELEVLRGGSQLIEKERPVVVFEVNLSQLRAHGVSPRALERFFARYEYRIYFPFNQKGLVLARVRSTTLLTALIAPRAWLFFGESAPFDFVAVPAERSIPGASADFMSAVGYVMSNNIAIKKRRLTSVFHRIRKLYFS